MTPTHQRAAAEKFAADWAGKGYEKGQSQPFWLALLRDVFGVAHPEQFISFEDQVKMDNTSFIDGYISATKVLVEQKGHNIDLSKPIKQSNGLLLKPYEQAIKYRSYLPYEKQPRWIVLCNFTEFHVYDMNKPSAPPEIILLENLPDECHRLGFLTNTGDERIKREMEVSLTAGKIVGKLYDALASQFHDATTERAMHSLNVLCVRLVFCLYAEDAGIFGKKKMFHHYMAGFETRHMRKALLELFEVLNQKPDERDPYMDEGLAAFPYVNGDLFAHADIEVPQFTNEIRELLLRQASDPFNWSEISPTIFGAVFESTLNPETRRKGGMHYTSIENIHKVIDPLFFSELKAEFEQICGIAVLTQKEKKLRTFQQKLAGLTFFDPACGSGNFLTETYISLRRLENEVLAELQRGQIKFGEMAGSPIAVGIGQFYGIEINDFAVTVATTALWIAESQMMRETESVLHMTLEFLPLKSYANITQGNALRLDWASVVPRERLNYIMGNPPFGGKKEQSDEQKADLVAIFDRQKGVGVLDFVSAWYKKAARFVADTSIRVAFVSTNSIAQGEQPAVLWKSLIDIVKIDFAYRPFKWDSESTEGKAAVHCVIVGFSSVAMNTERNIFDSENSTKAENINPYLVNAPTILIESRKKPLSDVQEMLYGSMPIDNGALILSSEDRATLLSESPQAEKLIRNYVGGYELLNGVSRYCLWLLGAAPRDIMASKYIVSRIEQCRAFRGKSERPQTKALADKPQLFGEIRQPETDMLAIPKVSSENRRYLPISFVSHEIIVNGSALIVPEATLYHFGVLHSNVHNAWMRAVCGRMKSDYQYSASVVYNNFPWPDATEEQQAEVAALAQAVLDARAAYPDSTLADMYGETTTLLHDKLLKAHRALDAAVMRLYGFPKGMDEAACVAELMGRYVGLVGEAQ